MPSVLLPNDLVIALKKVSMWMGPPVRHMANNVAQWADVFEADHEPTTDDLIPMRSVFPEERHPDDPNEPYGRLETPSSFWPKFEHRFRPAEERWVAEALPEAERAGVHGQHVRGLFDGIVVARDRLAIALPSDGRPPTTRAEGQAVLIPMRQLVAAMDAFMDYARDVDSDVPERRGWKAKRAERAKWDALNTEIDRWWSQGPHENLNY